MSNDALRDDGLETYRSLIVPSTGGFFCALANVGAAVAILAYLGNVAGKGYLPADMSIPMAWFLAGLVFCGSAILFAYFNRLSRLNKVARREDLSRDLRLWVAIALIICSLIAFAGGSWTAVVAFQKFSPSVSVQKAAC